MWTDRWMDRKTDKNEETDGKTDKQTDGISPISTNRWMDRQTDKRTKNGQTNTRNFTNFERILAMMVIYLPVKFEFDWSNRFKVRVRKRKCGQTDGWTDKRTKNRQANTRNFTNFERNLAMMVIYLPVKFEFDWSNCFKVRVRK